MKVSYTIGLLALFSLVACGNKSSGSHGDRLAQEAGQDATAATSGTYYAVLRPVNFDANGFLPYGMATFSLNDDQLQVSVSLDDDQAVKHRQTLHGGTRCPTSADDKNGDGFVDYHEAMAVVGAALMPLDGDLNSKLAGEEIYPRGPGMTYTKTASLSNINAELSGRGIGFEGRVVLVHGTSFQSFFPATLTSHDESEEAHISLPVDCGVLRKIE